LPNLVTGVTQRLSTKLELQRVQDFIARNQNNLGGATEAFSQALENINTNMRWKEKNLQLVHEWLSEQINPIVVEPTINYRLPKSLVPYHYDLLIQPFFRATEKPEYYECVERIDFRYLLNNNKVFMFTPLSLSLTSLKSSRCVADTDKFVLHMKNLDIKNNTLKIVSDSFGTIANFVWSYDNETSFLTVDLSSVTPKRTFLANNNYSFYAEFKGYITDDLLGFYRTSYKDDSNQTRY